MNEVRKSMRYGRFTAIASIAIAGIIITAYSLPSNSIQPSSVQSSRFEQVNVNSVANPEPPADMCQNMQVLVLLDRSESVTNEGSAVIQRYKDQVKKVWHTLHNISATYGGYSSGYLWAFAGRSADQMPRLLTKDNNRDGIINEDDRNLQNPDVVSEFDAMTQNIYFKKSKDPMYPSNQTADYGYNPRNEDTKYYTKSTYTNWHNAFLMAQDTVSKANTSNSSLKKYSMVIIVTDGEPTLDDGPNHQWDIFKKNAKIDENFDGSVNTASHVTQTKAVVDSLRQGKRVGSNTQTFDPVQVHGILIGGGSAAGTRMTNTFGTGNWFQSSNFDNTLGAHLLQIVAATCPPDPSLESGLEAHIVNSPESVIEDSDVTYTVDITNNGSALLSDIYVANGNVIDLPADSTYTSNGYLAPGKKRRFSVSVHVGGGASSADVTIPYSANVAEDASLMSPDAQMHLEGTLRSHLRVQLIPRPA